MNRAPVDDVLDVSGHYACQPQLTSGFQLILLACTVALLSFAMLVAWRGQQPVAACLLLLMTLYLGYSLWSSWRRQRHASRHAIDADTDGLWLSARGKAGTNSESLKLLPPQLQEANRISIPITGFGRVPAALLQALYRGWHAASTQDKHD